MNPQRPHLLLSMLFAMILRRPYIQAGLTTLGTLRLPGYRYLVLNMALTGMAGEARLMAQAWLILEMTNSDAWVGTVAGLPALVGMATALLGGVLADRLERRRMLTAIRLLQSAIALFAALLVATGLIQVWHLLIITFLSVPIEVTGGTTGQTMIIDTVPGPELFSANAIFSAATNLALLVGPALAGLILADAGVAYVYLFSALLYVGSALLASRIRVEQRRQGKSTTTVWADLKGGLQFVRQSPVLQWLLLIGLGVMSAGVWFALVPRFAKDVLDIGATGYGSILSARGAGGLVGVLLLIAAGHVKRLTLVLVVTYLCVTLLIIVFALSSSVVVAMVTAFGLGITFVWYPNALRTAFQISATDDMRGRVMSLFSIVAQLVTFGWLVGGLLSGWIGPQLAMISVALLGAAVHILGYVRSAELRTLSNDR